MAAKKKVMKEKVDLQTLTQQVVEKSHQLGVTGYEYHHNGVEMTLTGLNKVLNGTTKKTNLNNLRGDDYFYYGLNITQPFPWSIRYCKRLFLLFAC